MPETIAFSRYFPDTHRKAGQPTWFLEKILKSLPDKGGKIRPAISEIFSDLAFGSAEPKYHTIRSGTRFKAGDQFSPRVWLGDPHTSPQLVFAPDLEVKQTWSFDCNENGVIRINGSEIDEETKLHLAKNDGLSIEDFNEWLVLPCVKGGKPFSGQVICWSDGVCY